MISFIIPSLSLIIRMFLMGEGTEEMDLKVNIFHQKVIIITNIKNIVKEKKR